MAMALALSQLDGRQCSTPGRGQKRLELPKSTHEKGIAMRNITLKNSGADLLCHGVARCLSRSKPEPSERTWAMRGIGLLAAVLVFLMVPSAANAGKPEIDPSYVDG